MNHGGYGRGDYGSGLYGTDETAQFPDGVVRANVELLIGDDWTDITPLAMRDPILISRGKHDEGGNVDFGTCSLTLNNRNGDLSPRNPTSPYFGLLGLNTELRVSVLYGQRAMLSTGTNVGGATTPDAAAFDITGDIDLRFDAWMESWVSCDLLSKYGAAGQRSYLFWIDTAQTLHMYWSADGTTVLQTASTIPVAWPRTGRMALRATLDVNNGAAGNTVTFYYADNIDAVDGWTQLGDAVVTAGTTSIFNSTTAVLVPLSQDTSRVYAAQIYSGIDGTLKGSADFRIVDPESASFVASTGETWTLYDTFTLDSHVAISDRIYRFWGEAAELPVRWDTTGQDVYVPIKAAGPLRRIGQRTDVLQSAMRRAFPDINGTVAYWPCEDGAKATTLASALGGPAMSVSGSPTMASYTAYDGSGPIPVVSSSRWSGVVPSYTGTGVIEVRWLVAIPSTLTNGAPLLKLTCTGTAAIWTVNYATGGDIIVKAFDRTGGTTLMTSATGDFNMDGKNGYLRLKLQQSGADVLWNMGFFEVGVNSAGADTFSASLNSQSINQAQRVDIAPTYAVDDAAMGHILVSSGDNQILNIPQFYAIEGWAGLESAAGRIERICDENNVTLEILAINPTGLSDGSTVMGSQLVKTLPDLLHETEATDGGILYESLDQLGLVYRPRRALYNRFPAARLVYTDNNLDMLAPTDDDLSVTNTVTVTRSEGSSYTATQETGPLSVSAIGNYASQPTINNHSDLELPDRAGWLRHLGTVDAARWPQIGVNLANPSMGADSDAASGVVHLDVGDRLIITDVPDFLPPETISLMVQGYEETISNFEWSIIFNCTPEDPWQVGVYGIDRYSTSGSTLAESLSTSTTSFLVATATGPLWSTSASGYDIMVGGERMTVSSVTGSTSPQTFTVTRAVNLISKAHTIDDAVALFAPAHYAI